MLLRPINYLKVFMNSPTGRVISYTDEVTTNRNKVSESTKALFIEDSDPLSFVASCDCGYVSGNFHRGKLCPKCHTEARLPFANELQYKGWIEIPRELPPVLHPTVYRILKQWLGTKSGVSILDSLLNLESKVAPDLPVTVRGFDLFFMNFDTIMNTLLEYKRVKAGENKEKLAENADIAEFLVKWRHVLFTRYLPVLDETLHLLTKSGSITYCDSSTPMLLEAKIEIQNLIHTVRNTPMTTFKINRKMWLFYNAYISYIDSILNTKLYKKRGFMRKNMVAARTNFSFRAVITPIIGDHNADEVHLPWSIGVELLRMEILNRMQRQYGMTLEEALTRYYPATVSYDPLIDEIMRNLISECPYRGLPVHIWRNPKHNWASWK